MERRDFYKGAGVTETDELVFTLNQARMILKKLAGKEVNDIFLVGKLLAEKFKISDIKIIVQRVNRHVYLIFSNRNHFLTIKNGLEAIMGGRFRRIG